MLEDTILNIPSKFEDLMILRIGKTTSQFFSHYTFYADSLLNNPNGNKLFSQLTLEAVRSRDHSKRPFARTTQDYIYKRYPETDKLTTTSTLNLQRVTFDEVYESQNWLLIDSTKIILNYKCHLARCDFRGREYYAWYSPDIGISDGPWKFNGLPGLILEVYDKDRHYFYEIEGIYTSNIAPITFYNHYKDTFIKTTRMEFLQAQRRFAEEPFRHIKAATGLDLDPENKSFIEVKHDFLEKDYHNK